MCISHSPKPRPELYTDGLWDRNLYHIFIPALWREEWAEWTAPLHRKMQVVLYPIHPISLAMRYSDDTGRSVNRSCSAWIPLDALRFLTAVPTIGHCSVSWRATAGKMPLLSA